MYECFNRTRISKQLSAKDICWFNFCLPFGQCHLHRSEPNYLNIHSILILGLLFAATFWQCRLRRSEGKILIHVRCPSFFCSLNCCSCHRLLLSSPWPVTVSVYDGPWSWEATILLTLQDFINGICRTSKRIFKCVFCFSFIRSFFIFSSSVYLGGRRLLHKSVNIAQYPN